MSDVDTSYRIRLDKLRSVRLPVRSLESIAAEASHGGRRRRSRVTQPGYGKGRRPGNYGKKFPAEVLTPAEVRALLDACPARGPFAARNTAIIIVLWRCGLRVAELCALDVRDIDFERATVLVRHGKGDKRRIVGIDRFALDALEDWIAVRADYAPADGPLFVTLERNWTGRRIGTAYVREMLARLARRAGISKRVHPHGLRHTHAYELMEEGVPLASIRSQLGHASIAITAHYVDHLNPAEAIRAVQARSVR